MKVCSKCTLDKDLREFAKRTDTKSGYRAECKSCENERKRKYFQTHKESYTNRRRNHRKQRKEFINNLKDKPCMDCGTKYPPYVMDFDHRNPENKDFLISHATQNHTFNGKHRKTKGSGSVGMERLLKEIEKCDLVCSNCHRIRTHNRNKNV